ncbi:MAG: hypothetical protein AAF824_17330 [Bacteroidota bacterium]
MALIQGPRKEREIPSFVFASTRPGRFGSYIDPEWEEIADVRLTLLKELKEEFTQGVDRGSEELRVDLGVVLDLLGEHEEAINELEKAESRKDRHAYYPLGRIYLEREKYLEDQSGEKEAVSLTTITGYLQKSLQLDPDNIPAHYFLGKALIQLIQQESNEEIEEVYTRYLDAGAPVGYQEETQTFINAQDPQRQLQAFLKEGKELLEAGEADMAITLLENVISIELENEFYGSYTDDEWENLEKEELESAELAGRDLVEALFFLGQAYEQTGNTARAVDAYHKAQEVKVKLQGMEKAFADVIQQYFLDEELIMKGVHTIAQLREKTAASITKEERAALGEQQSQLAAIKHLISGINQSWSLLYTSSPEGSIASEEEHRIIRMGISPTNQWVISMMNPPSKLKMFDTEGRPGMSWEAHEGPILSAIFSPPAGHHILSTSEDKTVKLWDTRGNELCQLIGHEDQVGCLAFSPDGQFMLTGSGDYQGEGTDVKVRLYDKEGKLLQTMEGHEGQLTTVSFSPDGKYILSAGWGGQVYIWDLEGKLVESLDRGQSSTPAASNSIITSASYSPHGNMVLTTGTDDHLVLWKRESRRSGALLKPQKWENLPYADWLYGGFSKDGKKVLATTERGVVFIFDLEGNIQGKLTGSEVPLTYATFFEEDEKVMAVSSYGQWFIWEGPKANWRKVSEYAQWRYKRG